MNGSMLLGQIRSFKALAKYSDGIKRYLENPVWKSSTSAITIDDTGNATAERLGPSSISASETSLATVLGSALVTVVPAALRSIEITPTVESLRIGDTVSFIATGSYSNQTTQEITSSVEWKIDDSTIGKIENGIFKATTMPYIQRATITATYGKISATISLKIAPADLVGIEVFSFASNVRIGDSASYILRAKYSDSSTKIITENITWNSSNENVATIGSAGLLTPVATGTTFLKAIYQNMIAEYKVDILPATLDSISIAPKQTSLFIGESQQFSATGKYSDGTTADITQQGEWSTKSTTIAKADILTGNATGLSIGATQVLFKADSVESNADLTISGQKFVSFLANGNTSGIGVKPDGTLWFYTEASGVLQKITNSFSWVAIVSVGKFDACLKRSDNSFWICKNYADNSKRTFTPPTQFVSYSIAPDVNPKEACVRQNGTLALLGLGTEIGKTIQTLSPITSFHKLGPNENDTDWKEVAVSGGVIAAIKNDKTLWVSMLDDNRLVTPFMKILDNCKKVVVYDAYVLALEESGGLWEYGFNMWGGFFSDGSKINGQYPYSKNQVLGNWKDIATSSTHSAGIRTDGTAWTWGWNDYGQLGRGYVTRTSRLKEDYLLKQISSDFDFNFVSLTAKSSFFFKTDGSIFVCGATALPGIRQAYTTLTPA